MSPAPTTAAPETHEIAQPRGVFQKGVWPLEAEARLCGIPPLSPTGHVGCDLGPS